MRVEKKCKKCNYEWATIPDIKPLRNNEGKVIIFPDSYPHCGELNPTTILKDG